ncbi:RNA polymerase sigma factor [Ktedonobacter racemifer]|uniref:RNA polymerase, sigma-24 subunit, ECF subfamily n=1 Tax=Ktedonobacter racemifer DSM 44963 TaxID=485913 RepID=D6TYU3_KTERA|nr:RNA polymerase sigma factor [Ktedonobacter racemifer]EFH85168.1 RNA polymerase, sigma-24 subunit, ECF subfamily [Ktedonobacter racemifer DSM 44963]
MVTDEDLFRAWQHGDTGALETLVQRYHAPLLAHLYRVLTDTHLAEDLVQETFLRLIREAQSYQYPRPFRPWLYTIAHHLASHYYTSAYARRVELRAQMPAIQARDPDPAEWFERWERRHHLRKALAHLSMEQREVLSLRFGQELSIQETAAILSIPPGTVKSRTFTALRLLRASLEGEARDTGSTQGGPRHG